MTGAGFQLCVIQQHHCNPKPPEIDEFEQINLQGGEAMEYAFGEGFQPCVIHQHHCNPKAPGMDELAHVS